MPASYICCNCKLQCKSPILSHPKAAALDSYLMTGEVSEIQFTQYHRIACGFCDIMQKSKETFPTSLPRHPLPDQLKQDAKFVFAICMSQQKNRPGEARPRQPVSVCLKF